MTAPTWKQIAEEAEETISDLVGKFSQVVIENEALKNAAIKDAGTIAEMASMLNRACVIALSNERSGNDFLDIDEYFEWLQDKGLVRAE